MTDACALLHSGEPQVAKWKLMMSPSSTMYSCLRAEPRRARDSVHRAVCSKAIVADDFGADEATLDVAVNLARRHLCRRVARD